MAAMWSTFFSYLTDIEFSYQGFTFNLWDVVTADLILAFIGLAIGNVFLFWANNLKSPT